MNDAATREPVQPAKVYYTNLRTYGRESQLDKLKRLIKARRHRRDRLRATSSSPSRSTSASWATWAFCAPTTPAPSRTWSRSWAASPSSPTATPSTWAAARTPLEHIDCAYQNGFTPYATGCQVIIADGLKGTDETLVPVKNGEYVREAKIGHALMDADIVIPSRTSRGTSRPVSAAA